MILSVRIRYFPVDARFIDFFNEYFEYLALLFDPSHLQVAYLSPAI